MKPFSEMSRQEKKRAVNDAVSIIRQDYYDDVKGAAESIIEETSEQDLEGEQLREWLIEHIDEVIDNQQRVIYTWQARLGLLVSENDEAYFEEFGEEEGAVDASKLMYAAMRADVISELDDLDFDVNDPEEYFEEEE